METYIIILLCIAAFFAGFVDAIVGGGGLIQTPVALILLPNLAVSSIIGSLKIPAFSGTSFAAFQYIKQVKLDWKLLASMAKYLCQLSGSRLFGNLAMMSSSNSSF